MTTATSGSNPGDGDRDRSGGLPIPKSRRGIKGFYSEVVREMKKVNWPTKKETNRLTGVVMAVTIICVLILLGFGIVFGTLIELITGGLS